MRRAAGLILLCLACERAPRPALLDSSLPGSAPRVAKPAAPAIPDVDAWPKLADEQVAGDRIYSKVRFLWIRSRVGSNGWIGYLSLGDSVRVKGGDADRALAGNGDGARCDKWYAIEPVGYVCTGEDATLDPRDALIAELAKHRADATSPWPYRYGESLGTPIYHTLPTRDMQQRREQHPPFDEVKGSGEAPPKLLSLELPTGGRPILDRIIPGSMVAYTAEFDHEGRSFFMTWDRAVVPKDRVKPFKKSEFHGVVLGGEQRLPIAFFRGGARPKYKRAADGFATTGKKWPRLAWVRLTGQTAEHGKERFYETIEPDTWVAGDDAAIADKTEPPTQLESEGRRTWIDISILGGTLVAYEGETPVYATLVSPGRGGVPLPGIPTLATASTPIGTFPVVGKFLTATMFSSSNSDIMHTEVQYTQNFSGPYALHGAYWHDDWGNKKSGGCVNLAPIDARRIYRWTEPAMPEGWHGLRTNDFGPKTLVRLRR